MGSSQSRLRTSSSGAGTAVGAGHPAAGDRLGNSFRQELLAQRAMDDGASDGGAPIPYKDEMERAFGQDFTGVRAHYGRKALQGAGMRAGARGEDVVFDGASPSKEQVAHELVHVVQTRNGGSAAETSRPGDAAEREAVDAGKAVAKGEAVEVSGTATGAVQGNWFINSDSAIGDALNFRDNEAQLDAEEDLQDFMAKTYSLANFHPSTGRGLFDAAYDPAAGLLQIVLKVFLDFKSGDPADPQWVMGSSGAAHPMAGFAWTPQEIQAWRTSALSTVQEAWSDQYSFHSTRPFWEALPTVKLAVSVQEVLDSAAAHYVLSVQKWPEDVMTDGIVTPRASDEQSTGMLHESETVGNDAGSLDVDQNLIETSTRHAYEEAENANPGAVFFESSEGTVDASGGQALRGLGQVLGKAEMPPFPVTLTGHSSTDGSAEENERLAGLRAMAVGSTLVEGGAKKQPRVTNEGERDAEATWYWRRVDISVDPLDTSQMTVCHEFGHMLGLGDEYPAADDAPGKRPRTVGTTVAHSDLAQQLIPGQEAVVAHHDDSIMSVGNEIRPHHYVAFLDALGTMTGTTGEWAIGAGGALRARKPGAPDLTPPAGGTTASA